MCVHHFRQIQFRAVASTSDLGVLLGGMGMYGVRVGDVWGWGG